MIAFQWTDAGIFVCLVEKRSGKRGFPKGGLKTEMEETVLRGARREFHEETGIPLGRLDLVPWVVVDCDYLGVRYLVSWCSPANAGDPDDGCSAWAPPAEDPNDDDPIVRASWNSCNEILAHGARGCHIGLQALLERALGFVDPQRHVDPQKLREPECRQS